LVCVMQEHELTTNLRLRVFSLVIDIEDHIRDVTGKIEY